MFTDQLWWHTPLILALGGRGRWIFVSLDQKGIHSDTLSQEEEKKKPKNKNKWDSSVSALPVGKKSLRGRLRVELYLEMVPLKSRLSKNETDRLGSTSNRAMSL